MIFKKFKPQIFLIILIAAMPLSAQKNSAKLEGQVKDQFGGLIFDAEVTLINRANIEKVTATNKNGRFFFNDLAKEKYSLRVKKEDFSFYENSNIDLSEDSFKVIDVVLTVKEINEKIEVSLNSNKPSIDSDNNKDAIVLKEKDLEALPDDPEALEAVLKLLAGESGGPDGGQLYIDGSVSRNVPPKSSISEVRINRNPFSAEFDRVGYGRIEIITKIGKNEFNGSVFFKFNDESLNSRDPFAITRPPFQVRRYGGDISGSFLKNKASYLLDIDNREIDNSVIVNATVVDEQLRIVPFKQNYSAPEKAIFVNGRTDFQLNTNNTLSFRFGLMRKASKNVGVGDLALVSQAYRTADSTQTIQVNQTSVIKGKFINQFNFQYERYKIENKGNQNMPTILVSESFIGGNSQNGESIYSESKFELNNNVTFTKNSHIFRFGGRFRRITLNDTSPYNFGGTLIYNGGRAPRLVNGQVVFGSDGQPVLENITSIERYRRTLLFNQLGLSKAESRQRGGGASQFSINGGNPKSKINQLDFSAFFQDDWKLRSNFSISLGLRLESQSNIGRNIDFAPRLAFAWSTDIGKKKKLTTVIRGGLGVFYSRFSENLVLQTEHFNGNNVQQFIISDADILDSFEEIPTAQELSGFGQPLSVKRIANDVRTPNTLQTAISLEQQLPFKANISITYSNLRMRNALRSRNINAPFSANSERPNSNVNDIYQYESSGRFHSNRLNINFSKRIGKNSFGFTYNLNFAKSDTDGANYFPVNQYDLSNEFGRSALDIRHTLSLSGYFKLPFDITFTPLIAAASGKPFNITLGQDTNGDSLFTERPGFANNFSSNVVNTGFGTFDLNAPTSNVIPRNFGTGPAFFSVSTGISKNFTFDLFSRSKKEPGKTENKADRKRFTLNFSSRIWNVFNRPNLGMPVGNLTSPFFGKSVKLAGTYGKGDPLSGSRVIEFQLRLSF